MQDMRVYANRGSLLPGRSAVFSIPSADRYWVPARDVRANRDAAMVSAAPVEWVTFIFAVSACGVRRSQPPRGVAQRLVNMHCSAIVARRCARWTARGVAPGDMARYGGTPEIQVRAAKGA